jgi:hypothetical protein
MTSVENGLPFVGAALTRTAQADGFSTRKTQVTRFFAEGTSDPGSVLMDAPSTTRRLPRRTRFHTGDSGNAFLLNAALMFQFLCGYCCF